MEIKDINATQNLQNFITKRLKSLGYRNVEHVYIHPSAKHLLYEAVLPTEFIEHVARTFFSPPQIEIFEDISTRGILECQVLPDRTVVIKLQGSWIQTSEFTREQRHFIQDLLVLLRAKARMDLRNIQRALRKI